MKLITIIVFFSLSSLAYSQKVCDKVQGDWVCINILDLNGKTASGKFGASGEYLKFSFNKGNLSIMEAPFDKGITLPVTFGNYFIDIVPGAVDELPERFYTIKSMDGDSLVLRTINENNITIEYYFVNQVKYLNELKEGSKIIDNGIIIIKHFKSSKDLKRANHVSEYRIGNEKEHLYPCPIFADSKSSGFGSYFATNCVFPKSYQFETDADELIVDFDVTDEGVTNVKIVKGLNDEINASVSKVIEGSSKKWESLKIDGQTIKTTMRFHLVFIPTNDYSQDYFKTAVDYFQKGNYELADTFFTMQIKKYPYDRDALYNRAAIRLLFRDTCSFCQDLYAINNSIDIDKEVLEKYYSLCGRTDTVCYYDKNFAITNKNNYRYFEVIEHHKYIYKDLIIGKIHDRKRKYQITSINPSKTEHFTTNIIAVYKITSDGQKIYSIANSPPLFPGGGKKYKETIENSATFKQMKNDLKMPGAVIYYTYIIDKSGKAKDFKINNLYPEIDAEELVKRITQLYTGIPDFIPGKFRDVAVDFYVLGMLKF